MGEAEMSSKPDFFLKYHFLIRRLHSLSGIIPLGAFLVLHLMVNASILGGGQQFHDNVARIHALGPLLVPVEILGIFIPLAFHIGLGLKIAQSSRMNHGAYTYGANRRYSLQRITAYLATIFILYHLFHMHWLGKPLSALGGAQFDPEEAAPSAARAIQASWWIAPVYAIGVACTVYHFANGLWTSLITWGVTIGARSQRVAAAVCTVLGLAVGAVGLAAVSGFKTFDSGLPAEEIAPSHAMSASEPAPEDHDIDQAEWLEKQGKN